MSEPIKLSDFVESVKKELVALESDARELSIDDVELDLAVTAKVNDLGELALRIADQDCSNRSAVHRIKLKLSLSKELDKRNSQGASLSIEDDAKPEDEFEGFKQRFQDSVKRHGGVPPKPKKSIFD